MPHERRFFAIRPHENQERIRREDGLNLTELLYEFEYGEFAEHNQDPQRQPQAPRSFQELSPDDQLAETRMKKLRGALNKLSADNFYTHLYEIQDHLPAFSYHLMKMFVEFMVHKAIDEETYCPMYAYISKALSSIQLLEQVNGQVMDFGQVVLDETENVFGYARCALNWMSDDPPTEEEKRQIAKKEDEKRRILVGVTRFICELFKAQLISVKELYDFIRRLEKDKNEKCIEALSKLILSAGKEVSKSVQSSDLQQEWNYTWIRIGNLLNDNSLSTRLKFLLRDVVELKASNWVPRKPISRPKTTREIEFEERVSVPDGSSVKKKKLKDDPIVVLAEAKFTEFLTSGSNAFDQIVTWIESNENMNKPPYHIVYALTSSIVKYCLDDENLDFQKFNDLSGLLKRYCDTRMTELACLNSVYNVILLKNCPLANLEKVFNSLYMNGVVGYVSLLRWRDSWGSDPGIELKDKGWANLTLAPFYYHLYWCSVFPDDPNPSFDFDINELEYLTTSRKLPPEIYRGLSNQQEADITLRTDGTV